MHAHLMLPCLQIDDTSKSQHTVKLCRSVIERCGRFILQCATTFLVLQGCQSLYNAGIECKLLKWRFTHTSAAEVTMNSLLALLRSHAETANHAPGTVLQQRSITWTRNGLPWQWSLTRGVDNQCCTNCTLCKAGWLPRAAQMQTGEGTATTCTTRTQEQKRASCLARDAAGAGLTCTFWGLAVCTAHHSKVCAHCLQCQHHSPITVQTPSVFTVWHTPLMCVLTVVLTSPAYEEIVPLKYLTRPRSSSSPNQSICIVGWRP